MKILFAHGLESGPNGFKIRALREAGFEVIAPELPKDDFQKSVDIIRKLSTDIDIIVGSSRGGAVVMAANVDKPKILLAPAWKKFGVEPIVTNAQIIHGTSDDVVPVEDSVEINGGCLHVINDDHRLHNSMNLLKHLINIHYENFYTMA